MGGEEESGNDRGEGDGGGSYEGGSTEGEDGGVVQSDEFQWQRPLGRVFSSSWVDWYSVWCQGESVSVKNRFRQKLVKRIVKVTVLLQVATQMVEEAQDSPEDCENSTNVIP